MHSSGYIIRFIIMLTAVAALLLSVMFTGLKSKHDLNEALFNKRAVLAAVNNELDKSAENLSDEEVLDIFENQVEQIVLNMDGEVADEAVIASRNYKGVKAEDIDMAKEKKRPAEERLLPLFIFNKDGEKYYIVSVRGSGLWDEIWGNIALEDDLRTIAGVSFDHKAETPGLGAEIKDSDAFKEQFVGKKIYNDKEYTSVVVKKGGVKNDNYEVDGISGATITGDGVTEMMYRGIKYYQPYFDRVQEIKLN